MNNREFYVGYISKAPPGLAKFMVVTICMLGVLVVGIALVAGSNQAPFDDGTFEFGIVKEFDGVLLDSPLPHIRLTRSTDEYDIGKTLLIVDQGKHGFPVYALEGMNKIVRVSGSLIHRDDTVMLEMGGAEEFKIISDTKNETPEMTQFGTVTLTGELVDTKCFLGVMRPGTGKVHRACAVNCLVGGIPPGILVEINDGMKIAILLAGEEGEPSGINPQWAGRVIRVTGPLSQLGDVPMLTTQSIELVNESSIP